ncbi:SMP-30/gluconolactonase/LRE family protein [Marinomonas sp. 15G1-11]|uniref:SMP-30/gluconolactonase/LRE family protein n=1 Tax=Marinomonas phaeophyticola TaxID=3004091 RepID=A0ABT4JZJ6_9GAMM|nr:SMP-30/gluconolactonase/LRE family protein [Marinomonas sp. 15G1-11]MCZ2723675.1 SMP-30/gluconolactonase/LRE family protein [Marinomonas sp. 15G1-11]
MTTTVTQISQQRHHLAEGPFWSDAEQSLYWVDIPACQVWCWNQTTGQYTHWTLPQKVSAVFTTQSNRLLVTLADGVAYLDKETGVLAYLCKLDEDIPGNRSNDAKCDANGSLWVGTMDDAETSLTGRLWKVLATGEKQKMLDGIGIANTLAWDESRDVFYFGDSMKGAVHAFSSAEFTDIRDQEAFLKTPAGMGPDGSAIDVEGCLWNAQWDGSRVVRYSPQGEILQVIELPFAKPTSCAFGGANGKTLFITSASVDMNETELEASSLAGHVVAIEVDVAGAPGQAFAGA